MILAGLFELVTVVGDGIEHKFRQVGMNFVKEFAEGGVVDVAVGQAAQDVNGRVIEVVYVLMPAGNSFLHLGALMSFVYIICDG